MNEDTTASAKRSDELHASALQKKRSVAQQYLAKSAEPFAFSR